MPSLRKARNQARNLVCSSNLRQWGLIFAMYIDDNGGVYPKEVVNAMYFIRGTQDPDIRNPMSKYVKTMGIGLCPMAKNSLHIQILNSVLVPLTLVENLLN